MIRVVLHGRLKEQFGESFNFEVASPAMALRALISQVKGFEKELRQGAYRIVKSSQRLSRFIQDEQELLFRFGASKEFHIFPVLAGGIKALAIGKIVLGVALVAVAAYFSAGAAAGFAATAIAGTGVTFGGIASFGAALALSGVASLLTPVPNSGDFGSRNPADQRPSFLFNGPVNSVAQGVPVPMVYGQMQTGTIAVSTSLSTEAIR